VIFVFVKITFYSNYVLELRDLIVTPVFLFLVYLLAYIVRPMVTDQVTRSYFIPALTLRMVGCLAVGVIYQFYYGGGDTFNFHTHGSRHIWEAFVDSPSKGMKLLFSDGKDVVGIYQYASKIPFFGDPSSYSVIRIAAFFDLFTFSSYSATALCFAIMSFGGGWMMFLSFYKSYNYLHRYLAWAILFLPSVFFWGSGLLKDSISLSAVCAATYIFREFFVFKKLRIKNIALLGLCLYIIYVVKIYILLCYLPAILLLGYAQAISNVKTPALRWLLIPLVIIAAMGSSYLVASQIGSGNQKYNLNALGNTAQITAYDIAFQTGRDAGSTYSLGALDGSFGSLVRLAPQAINVTLFRPYVWEIRNPLMLLSAVESFAFIIITTYAVFLFVVSRSRNLFNPDVIFCLLFSVVFAFGVGVSTYNFGTLSRYKIPLLPFYAVALVLLVNQSKRARKLEELDKTE
jgi:hypothetical protein